MLNQMPKRTGATFNMWCKRMGIIPKKHLQSIIYAWIVSVCCKLRSIHVQQEGKQHWINTKNVGGRTRGCMQRKKLSRRSCIVQVHQYDKLVLPIVYLFDGERCRWYEHECVFREQQKKLSIYYVLSVLCMGTSPSIMNINGSYTHKNRSEFRVNLSAGNTKCVCAGIHRRNDNKWMRETSNRNY